MEFHYPVDFFLVKFVLVIIYEHNITDTLAARLTRPHIDTQLYTRKAFQADFNYKYIETNV